MEIILLVIIILLIGFLVYYDYMTRIEREKLQLKLMVRDVKEYKDIVEKPPKDTKQEDSPYEEVEDVSIDTLLKAKDNT